MNPKFSICATCYNHEQFIPFFIESVLAQTLLDWELIVIDDCSTDGSFALLEKYAAQDSRIRVFRNDRNRHICYSGNRAISMARGELVTFISCDDGFAPNKLQGDCDFFAGHPDVSVLYGELMTIDKNNTPGEPWVLPYEFSREKILRTLLFEVNTLFAPGLALRRSVLDRIGGVDPLLRLTQDYEWHLRIFENFDAAKTVRRETFYRRHFDNLFTTDYRASDALHLECVYFLKRHYLTGIKSVDLLKSLCPEVADVKGLAEDLIPFCLARHAMKSSVRHVMLAGALALNEYLQIPEHRARVEAVFDFLDKDFMLLTLTSAQVYASAKIEDELRQACATITQMEEQSRSDAARLQEIMTSWSYRTGHFLLAPLRITKRFFAIKDARDGMKT